MRQRIGSVPIDPLTMQGALDAIVELARDGGGTVFTPNVDHVVLAEENEAFRTAYLRASLSLVDGMPVLWATRLLGKSAPEKVSGSDLVIPLAERAAREGLHVYILGGAARAAAKHLETMFPSLVIAGTDESRIDPNSDLDPIARRIRASRADIVLVALGAPKQEIVADQIAPLVKPAVLVGVGAAIDFIAGKQKRAPSWMSRHGLEWLYRLMREPRRMARRYLVRDPKFLFVLWREVRSGFRI